MTSCWTPIKSGKDPGKSRKEFLERAAEIEGLYVPQFYDAAYREDGTLLSFTPNNAHAPEKVKKQAVMEVTDSPYPMKPVVPFYQGDPGQSGARDPARLHPRDAVSARQG